MRIYHHILIIVTNGYIINNIDFNNFIRKDNWKFI